ncbi:hypothetical protein E1B28_000851 [Marasmius oreades]|uniref:Uncharacterized protein n=1 Tax=Marasmius oreades TaxID=181124 RepID=A0A9P7V274_9AGAR|nr:uncharacterized protein E1B28_000851 [Marasmius oreades]KAG7098963.1 hypothetical protein E1B28_000851 [Marasmius oreades]
MVDLFSTVTVLICLKMFSTYCLHQGLAFSLDLYQLLPYHTELHPSFAFVLSSLPHMYLDTVLHVFVKFCGVSLGRGSSEPPRARFRPETVTYKDSQHRSVIR